MVVVPKLREHLKTVKTTYQPPIWGDFNWNMDISMSLAGFRQYKPGSRVLYQVSLRGEFHNS